MSEEHDPVTGQARGNFPQAYSHLGLIENALNLAENRGR
jgi:GH15 family glucan-1,4-alpha-glucosidase